MKKIIILLPLFFPALFSFSQKLKKEDKLLVDNLQQHIRVLADDKLEGRRTGTKGEQLAAAYISQQFQKAGLSAKGTDSYFQTFDIQEGKQINPDTYLTIDGHNLTLNKDFFPMVWSPNLTVEALPSRALQEPGMPWFYDLKDLLEENTSNPHFDIEEAIVKSTREVKRKGATAIFLYNSTGSDDGLKFNSRDKTEPLPIPVIYISNDAVKKYLADDAATIDVKFKIDISEKKRTGTNVVGYIDNAASNTVILGAHFDHLGYGEDGNSREVEKKLQIHNGADDNASGTAALIELARILNHSKLKANNYLFVAFSGEELGLYGSKYFMEHPTIDISKVNYMINMDMIGRLNDSSNILTVGGYGTSPGWGEIYGLKGKKKLYNDNLEFRFDSSGTGPSDHTTFYLKNIPVLFYFTGLHPDYHKPSDDFERINYSGEMDVVKHILSVIEAEDKIHEKLVFTKTRETQTTTSARFAVTLGIMPDYTYSGAGVRVDGISENKPAQRAGMQAGDVITALGEYRVTGLENYMQALGKFKKGEKTTVTFSRGSQTLSAVIEF